MAPELILTPSGGRYVEGRKLGVLYDSPTAQQPPIFLNTYTGDGLTQFINGEWCDVDVSTYVPADAVAVYIVGLLIISHGTTIETADMTLAFRTTREYDYGALMQCTETQVNSGQREPAGTWVALDDSKKFQVKWVRNTGDPYPLHSSFGVNLSLVAYSRPDAEFEAVQAQVQDLLAQVAALSQSVSAAAAAAAASAEVAAARAGEAAAAAVAAEAGKISARGYAEAASADKTAAGAYAAAAADSAAAAAASGGGGACTCTASLRTKVGTIQRALSDSNSTESYFVGFRPAHLTLFATCGGFRPGGVGLVDSAAQKGVILSVFDSPAALSADGSRALALYTTSSGLDYVLGMVTLTDTGFDITWSKAGNPFGIYTITYSALALQSA